MNRTFANVKLQERKFIILAFFASNNDAGKAYNLIKSHFRDNNPIRKFMPDRLRRCFDIMLEFLYKKEISATFFRFNPDHDTCFNYDMENKAFMDTERRFRKLREFSDKQMKQ